MRFCLLALLLLTSAGHSFVSDAKLVLADREPAPLNGFWNFVAGSLQGKLRVDKEWRLQGIQNVGKAGFSLHLTIPDSLRSGDFGLILPPVSAAVRISLNGRLVVTKGIIEQDLRYPQDSSEAFTWYPIKKEFLVGQPEQLLELEITGFSGGGGLYGNSHIYFGGIEEIKTRYNQILFRTVFLAAAIFMIALFHLALVPDTFHRRANLHYVLLAISMSAHILGMNGLGYLVWNQFLFNAGLIHLLVAAFPFALTGFTLRYFRLQYPRIRQLAYFYGAGMGSFLIALAAFPQLVPLYLGIGLPFGVAMMSASLVFALFGAVLGMRRGIEGAALVFAGFLIYGLAVVNDVIFYFSYATPYKLADIGFLVAVVSVALALAWRLRRSNQEREELREWQKEVTLAAHIQHQALPQRTLRTPHLQIATLFKPMKIIGGDFFAFHEISENETGVFIADVSGHGIAAALTVNTLRTVFHQFRDCARSPAELLGQMNRALYPHLHEQFVTAAYCLFDFDRNRLRIAQAGHPPVYLLRKEEATYDKVKPKGRFFGFDREQAYEEVEFDLSRYRRVFLYSDGVIEAGALKGNPYSVRRLEKLLASTHCQQQGELLQILEHDIRAKTGTEMNTDDDSSCVVADLLAAA
ncbi:MAG: PP2C family protein-serine/threonine phosphatase [Spirochaetota bacterium]